MTWPTMAEVDGAEIEQLRSWLNGLPGCRDAGQISLIRRMTERIVATWPKRTRPLMPVEVAALADLPRPEGGESVTPEVPRLPKCGPRNQPKPEPEEEAQGALHFLAALKRN